MSKGFVYHQAHLEELATKVIAILFGEDTNVSREDFTDLVDTLSHIVAMTPPIEDSSFLVFIFEEDENLDFNELAAKIIRLPSMVQAVFVRPVGTAVEAIYITRDAVPAHNLHGKIAALKRLSR